MVGTAHLTTSLVPRLPPGNANPSGSSLAPKIRPPSKLCHIACAAKCHLRLTLLLPLALDGRGARGEGARPLPGAPPSEAGSHPKASTYDAPPVAHVRPTLRATFSIFSTASC